MALATTLFYQKFAEAHRQYHVQVYAKDQKWQTFWRVADALLWMLSFTKLKLYTDYVTTIGKNIFFPAGWNNGAASRHDYITLCHELEHVKQFDKWSTVGMSILYLLFPFPIGLAYFRYRFEREAYVAGYHAASGVGVHLDPEHFVTSMAGSAYLWAWPFKKSIRAWLKKQGIV